LYVHRYGYGNVQHGVASGDNFGRAGNHLYDNKFSGVFKFDYPWSHVCLGWS
jgi:hypothetical protein